MCAPALRTPGMVSNSAQARCVIRSISGWEVPAVVIQCIKKSRSLNAGSRSRPMNGSTESPASTMATMAK